MLALGLGLACTEPNPYAQESSDDATTGEPGETGTETGDPPGCGDPACELGLEVIEFSLQGDDSLTTSIPKPADQVSVPIAAVHRYDPGQSNNFGYAIAWTDEGDSWGLEISVAGAAPNSRLSGVAAVIGLGSDFAAPELHELEVTTSQACAQLETDPLDGRIYIDTVERYEPGDADVFEFSRTENVGETAQIEYCVSQPDDLEGLIKVKLIAFDLPEGALAEQVTAVLDSSNGGMASFGSLGDTTEIVHLLGARALSEASEPGLGYAIDCAAQAPYACSYGLQGFKDGAAVEVGGAVLAIQ